MIDASYEWQDKDVLLWNYFKFKIKNKIQLYIIILKDTFEK